MKIMPFFCGALMTVALTASRVSMAGSEFDSGQVKALHKIIYNYIVDNPQVLVAASEKLRQQEEQKQQSAAIAAIKANKKHLFDDELSPATGNQGAAAVTIVEFFDYRCGHCRTMEPVIEKVLANNKNIKVVYKELPIFGGVSQYASEAALAAMKQGNYLLFHQALMKATPPLNNEKVLAVAKKAGLNVDKLKEAMSSPSVQKAIKANFSLAEKLKLSGTPAFILTNKDQTKFKFIPGAMSQANLEEAIKKLS